MLPDAGSNSRFHVGIENSKKRTSAVATASTKANFTKLQVSAVLQQPAACLWYPIIMIWRLCANSSWASLSEFFKNIFKFCIFFFKLALPGREDPNLLLAVNSNLDCLWTWHKWFTSSQCSPPKSTEYYMLGLLKGFCKSPVAGIRLTMNRLDALHRQAAVMFLNGCRNHIPSRCCLKCQHKARHCLWLGLHMNRRIAWRDGRFEPNKYSKNKDILYIQSAIKLDKIGHKIDPSIVFFLNHF